MVRNGRLILAILAALVLAGCATPPDRGQRESEDPEVWRPANRVFPLPD